MNIAIVKYNAGNIRSVVNALERLGITPLLTDNADELRRADGVLFPGQGHAGEAMAYLRQRGLDKVIASLRQPVLGICVGQQLLCRHSEEGDVDCIGVFDVPVVRFRPQRHEDKVPAMGWNALAALRSPLFDGLNEGDYTYFVHSFYVPLCADTAAQTTHITTYSAALQRDNFFACQFHPEKSGPVGEKILANFIRIVEHWPQQRHDM